ncbi:MAG: flagellar motor switch protein FliN [Stellaceae bacterium]
MADEDLRPTEPTPASATEPQGGLARTDSPFENLEAQGNGKANGETNGRAVESGKLDLVMDIPLRLSVELGRTELPIREVMRLGRGSMVELDRGPGAPLDVRVNGILIGRGEVVVVNEERLGLRFVEVVSPLERAKKLR